MFIYISFVYLQKINNQLRVIMKTNIDITISNSDEAKAFLTELYNNEESYHPEDNAHDIINLETGLCFFSSNEANQLNNLMNQVYEHADFDPCELLLELMNN